MGILVRSPHTKEIWRNCQSLGENYQVSNLGRIRRARNAIGGKGTWAGRILAQNHNLDGYRTVQVWLNGKHKGFLIHCLVAEAFLGNKPENFQVNHKNCDKDNCRVENLEYITPSGNMKHAYERGRLGSMRGEENSNAKLNIKDVLKIRKPSSAGNTQERIALMIGTTRATVSDILLGRTWRGVF